MADVRIYLPDELEERFKRRSTETYGRQRIHNKAGAEAIQSGHLKGIQLPPSIEP